MKELTKNNIEINLFYGNRDFHIDLFFRHILGVKVLGNSQIVEINNKKILLTHGDMLCAKDASFKIASNIIRSRFIKKFFLALPFELRCYLANGYRRVSKRVVLQKQEEVKELVYDTARDIFKRGVDIIICGHIHKSQKIKFAINNKDAYLYTLGDWENRTSFLEFTNGEFHIQNIYGSEQYKQKV